MKEQSLTISNLSTGVEKASSGGYLIMNARWDTTTPEGICTSHRIGTIFHLELSNPIDKLKGLATEVQKIFETQCKKHNNRIHDDTSNHIQNNKNKCDSLL